MWIQPLLRTNLPLEGAIVLSHVADLCIVPAADSLTAAVACAGAGAEPAPAAVAAAKPARFCDDVRITMAERFSLAKTARDLANPTVVGPIPNQSAPNKSRPKRGRPLGSKNKPASSGPRSPPKKSLRDAE